MCYFFKKSHSAFEERGWKQRDTLEDCCNSPGIHNGLNQEMTTERMRSSLILDVFEGEADRTC